MSDHKAVIKNADMSEEMQQDSVDCATQALEKCNIEKSSSPCRKLTDAQKAFGEIVDVVDDCSCVLKKDVSKQIHLVAEEIIKSKIRDKILLSSKNNEVEEKLRIQIKNQKTYVETYMKRADSLFQENEKLSEKIECLNGENEKLSEKIKCLNGENEKLSEKIECLNGESKNLNIKINNYKEENESLKIKLLKENDEFLAVIDKMCEI